MNVLLTIADSSGLWS